MESVELDHHCESCGKVSTAQVAGRDWIAVESAGQDARVAAQEEAAELIRLARCPRCGRRSATAVRQLIIGSAARVVAAFALGVLAVVLLALGRNDPATANKLAALSGLGAAGLMLTAFTRTRARWRDSEDCVHFAPTLGS